MVKESFTASSPLEAYKLAIQKYGSIDNFKVIKASQYKNSDGTLVAQIEIEVDSDSFYEGMGISEEELLIEELNSLKSKMNKMKESLLTQDTTEKDALNKDQNIKTTAIIKVKDTLTDRGLDKKWVNYMLDPFTSTEVGEDESLLLSFILEELEDSLKIDHNFLKNSVHLFIGATGVGKTTTIAKTIGYILSKGVNAQEIAVINLDTFRAAANEQLNYHARKMGVEYYFAQNDTILETIFSNLTNKKFILIDSAGSAPYDLEKLLEIVKFHQKSKDFIGELQTNLVVSAGVKYRDLKNIYEHFSFLRVNSLIVTKIDETKDVGNIIAFLLETNLPISFISTGQNVPQDLEQATTKKILEYFIGDLKQ